MKKPTLAGAMTPFPLAIDLQAPIHEADQMMRKHGIHHLPVTDGRAIVGTLSAYDIASRAHRDGPVQDCYAPEPYLVEIETPLETVLEEMTAHHLDCAVVMRHGRLAGIFTQHDVCRTFSAFLHVVFPPPPEDDAA